MRLIGRGLAAIDRWAAKGVLNEPLGPGQRVLCQDVEIAPSGNHWIATTSLLLVQPSPTTTNEARRDHLTVHEIPYTIIRELRAEALDPNRVRRTVIFDVPGEQMPREISGVFRSRANVGNFWKVLSELVEAARHSD